MWDVTYLRGLSRGSVGCDLPERFESRQCGMADDEVTNEDTRGTRIVDASEDPCTDLHLSSVHIHWHHTVNTRHVTVNTGTILSTQDMSQ